MKLLFVDDSKFNLFHAIDIINNSDIKCEIFTANSGEKALKLVENSEIDIIILDIIMPGLTGLDVLKKIRSNDKYRNLIIIMFTSITDKEYLKKSFELGANDYINKPIDEAEFLSRIKNAINLKKSQMDLYELMYILKEKNKKLEKTTSELKRTQSQLIKSEKLSAIGQFAAGIAHQINNPLGYISSNNEVMRKYCNSYKELIDNYKVLRSIFKETHMKNDKIINKINEIEEIEESLNFDFINEDVGQLIDDSAGGIVKISNIVKSLMNFAKVDEKDKFKLNDFNKILLNTVKPLEEEFNDLVNINFELNELQEVFCDEIQIGEVIYNIVLNAVQAIEEQNREDKGHIEIRTCTKGNYIKCSIHNDGFSIDSEIIDKIFDPFFTTKAIGKGTGLGLNVCYDIVVNKHKGDLSVKSGGNQGTTFNILLPLNKVE